MSGPQIILYTSQSANGIKISIALEELGLPKSPRPTEPSAKWAYDLKIDNRLMWARVMDWTHMRRLDFHSNGPSLFFKIFTNRLPNLKYLRWGTSHEGDISGYRGSSTCASAFMAFVIALDEVAFDARDFNDFVRGILEILNAEGPNLKILSLTCQHRNEVGFTITQYRDLLERAPRLENLKIPGCGAFIKGVREGKNSELSPAEKWNTLQKNQCTLRTIGMRNRNEAYLIWVPGQRHPGTATAQGLHHSALVARRNEGSAVSEQDPHLDYFR